jgi:exosortase family protein XrtF
VIFFSGLLLRIFGFTPIEQTFEGMRTIGIDGTNGLWIGDSCDGISLFAVFAIIIICFPGPWKKKMWFIPIGILLIHIFNIIRVTALCMIIYYSPQSLAFNHTYTFQILAYALIFFLWIRWINKYSGSYTEKI